MEQITCFNRDEEGRCLAFTKGECSRDCYARLRTVEDKIALLGALLERVVSTKERNSLKKELSAARAAKALLDQGKFEGWMSCYLADLHRGEKGGASGGDSSNRSKGMKQLMKDNRPVGVKPTKEQTEQYKKALAEFEEQQGEKMEKLGRSGVSHSGVDSYTGIPLCLRDNGFGKCEGDRFKNGKLKKKCEECEYLNLEIL